uniref:PX domain-containing protein n=1 Tax=Globisporangium ultimum (strain ATCC 200006 / CBS 805.95 / DAOM BR144) TaxID=431595 RepID=K3WE18_GLOUD
MAQSDELPRNDAGAATLAQVRPLAPLARKPSFVEKSMPIKKAPHLQPVALAPERWSAAMAPLAFLGTIERIEINRTRVRDGVTYYVLDVYLYHVASRLPTNLNNLRRSQSVCTSRVAREDAQPDYQVERRFSEFCELRQSVYDSVSKNPHFNCRHCSVFVEYVRFNGRQPRSFVKLMSGINKRKMILSEFMNAFLRMAQNKELQNRKCLAEDQVPHLLEEFVRDPERHLDPLARLSWL